MPGREFSFPGKIALKGIRFGEALFGYSNELFSKMQLLPINGYAWKEEN